MVVSCLLPALRGVWQKAVWLLSIFCFWFPGQLLYLYTYIKPRWPLVRSNEPRLPFELQWKDEGFVASMDDSMGIGTIWKTAAALFGVVLVGLLAFPIGDGFFFLGLTITVGLILLVLTLTTVDRPRAVLECSPELVSLRRTFARGHQLDPRRITKVAPGSGGLFIATDTQRIWVPCPDAEAGELCRLLEEAGRRSATFEADMAQPQVQAAGERARSILAHHADA